jgi:PAS domain S-box-containing protein
MKQSVLDLDDTWISPFDIAPAFPGEWYRELFANNASAMIVVDSKTGLIRDANAAAARLYGMDRHELLGINIGQINTASEAEIRLRITQSLGEPGLVHEFSHRTATGLVEEVAVSTYPFEAYGSSYILSSIRLLGTSMPNIRKRELLLKNEGMALRRELDHRVRNNLQFLRSLIGIERKRKSPEAQTKEFERLEGFIEVIANVYETTIDNQKGGLIKAKDLFELLLASEGLGACADKLACSVEMDLDLRLDQAISIGLLFKMMLFNATDGAGRREHAIFRIRGNTDSGMAAMEIEDNLPPSQTTEFGTELITKAATAQISATLDIRTKEDGQGTIYALKFPLYRLLPLV